MTNFNLALPLCARAQRSPQRAALWVDDREFSYSELLDPVERIAAWLQEKCAGEVHRVGILASRSVEACAGILGACWAGAAYVPFNMEWPAARIIKVLETIELDALIVDAGGLKLLSNQVLAACPKNILVPDSQTTLSPGSFDLKLQVAGFSALPRPSVHHPPKEVSEDDLAYLIFTSGTTGSPKGVMISGGSVFHMLRAMRDRYPFSEQDRVAQIFDLTFDVSVLAMFIAWSAGAALYVVPGTQLAGPSRFIQEREITVWFSVPSTVALMRKMKLLNPGVFPSLRYSGFAGEPLPLSSVEAWWRAAPNSIIENLYGPTEATVVCVGQKCSEPPNIRGERGVIAIGRPFEGMEAAIIDPSNRFLPAGEIGQLVLSGRQLSQGYLKDAAKTAARFPEITGKVWYLTGDLACQDDSGTFHYLGRIDHQVKVLGHRIELEDVEANLREVCGTDLVAAIAWPIVDGSAQGIVAFISGTSLSVAEVRNGMKSRVPPYMVPSQVHIVESLPFSASGKVDRKALASLLPVNGVS